MKTAFREAGVEVVLFPFDFNKEDDRKDTRLDPELTKAIVMTLMSDSFDALFSFNYFPVAAMAAKACRIRYISWVYDSPYLQLYSQTINYPTNDIRLFDRAEVAKLRAQGVENVSYWPLAADTSAYEKVNSMATAEDVKRFTSDISFVGAMYTEPRQQLYERLTGLSERDKGYLEGIVQAQKHLYGQAILEELLLDNAGIVDRMNEVCPVQLHPDGFETREWVYANFYLCRHVTALERVEIMTLLSENNYDLKIYTSEEGSKSLPESVQRHVCGKVDYYKESPIVFAHSKINLNITLRSIGSGIPLRAFEIMGSGGFLLTNYQEDMLEYFVPDEDFVYYTDYQDLIRKIDYYLENEEERERIARNGYEKVKKNHTFLSRTREL